MKESSALALVRRVESRQQRRVLMLNGRGNYVAIQSEAVVRRLVAMARVKEWSEVHWLWARDDFLLGNIGQCLGLAGLRSQTVIDQNELWFEGADMSNNQFVSARLTRDWVRKELNRLMV